jgi:hypothetical protein
MKTFIPTVCLVTLLSLHALAWDNPGHMAVAGLAYDELAPAQQQKLVALLKQHPDLAPISDGFPDGVPSDREFVMAAATWPDLIKNGHPEYKNIGYEADQPAVTNVQYDKKQHRGWHFIDMPLWVGHGAAPQALPPVPKVNAVGVVNVLLIQLRSNEADAAKAYDIGWLLHLVGDLHQPLHAVNGVSEAYPEGDTGGNNVVLAGETHSEPELHAYWDDILGKTARSDRQTFRPRLDKDTEVASHIVGTLETLPFGANSDNLDPATWAAESFKMAARDAYNVPLENITSDRGNLQATLNDDYRQTAIADAKQRIRTAGHRLALLLKQIF